MAMFKRIFLFIAVNMLVMITISVVLSLLGVRPYLTAYGIDYEQLAVFCLVWGMGGAFISLAISRMMAKWMMGVKVINPQVSSGTQKELLDMVYRISKQAGLPAMPEVGIYDSPEINAFATGPTKSRALVAVSSGLLNRMDRNEVEGVIGHEIAHIANGDMVTMTLIQGVINAFVMFLSRVFAFAISQALASRSSDDDRGGAVNPLVNMILVIVFDILFSILGSIVVAYFSRLREFRADAGGARLAGREKMIGSLKALKGTLERIDDDHKAMATLKISGRPSGFLALFSTHPSLEERIMRLERMG